MTILKLAGPISTRATSGRCEVFRRYLKSKVWASFLFALSALAYPGYAQEGMEARFQALLGAEGDEYVRLRNEFLADKEAAKAFLTEKREQGQGKSLAEVLLEILEERLDRGQIIREKIDTFKDFQVGEFYNRCGAFSVVFLTVRFEEEPMLLVEALWKHNELYDLFPGALSRRKAFLVGPLSLLNERRASPIIVRQFRENNQLGTISQLGRALRGLGSPEDVKGITQTIIESEATMASDDIDDMGHYSGDVLALAIKWIGDHTCVDILREASEEAKSERWKGEFEQLADFLANKDPENNERSAMARARAFELGSIRRVPAVLHWVSKNADAVFGPIFSGMPYAEYEGTAIKIDYQEIAGHGSCVYVEATSVDRISDCDLTAGLMTLGPDWHGSRFECKPDHAKSLQLDSVRLHKCIDGWFTESYDLATAVVVCDYGLLAATLYEVPKEDKKESKRLPREIVVEVADFFVKEMHDAMEGWREELLNTPPEDLEWWDRKMAEEIRKASTETR